MQELNEVKVTQIVISNNKSQNVKNKYSSMKDLMANENSNYDGKVIIVSNSDIK